MMQKFFISLFLSFSFIYAQPSKESQFLELMQHELPRVLPDFQTVSSLMDGGPSFINHVYLITLNDGKECIIKIGNPIWKGDKTLNEVTALKYLKANTQLPVPSVLTYECSREKSAIGCEYIIMPRLPGKPLNKEIDRIYQNKETYHRILDQLGSHIAELKKIKFSRIGNFKLHNDALEINDIVDFAHYHIDSPCDTFSQYARHALQYYIQEMKILVFKGSPDSQLYLKYIPILENFLNTHSLEILDMPEPFVFSHQDFVMKNILVHNDNISAILDWEWSGSALLENESFTGFDFLRTEEDRAYFSSVLEKHGIYNFFASPPASRQKFYRLLGNVYTLVAFREWKEGKLEHTAKFLNQKLEQRRIRATPDFDFDSYIQTIMADIDTCLANFDD